MDPILVSIEAGVLREVGKGDDYREGIMAFLEKREPQFTGR